MSIVRVGLAETKKFAEGYEAIFGKAASQEAQPSQEPRAEKTPADKKKKAKKPKKK